MTETVIILAGGASSRMKNRSSIAGAGSELADAIRTLPKAMLPVGPKGEPFLGYLLGTIERANYGRVIILVGEGDESIARYCAGEARSGRFRHMNVETVVQEIPPGSRKPAGTADGLVQALRKNKGETPPRFTVCNSDNLYSEAAFRELLGESYPNSLIDYDRSALKYSEERISRFAVLTKDTEGHLSDIIEKPSPDQVREAADRNGRIGVSMNLWRFTTRLILPFLEAVPLHPVRLERELPVAVRMMIRHQPSSVFGIPRSEHVQDLTSAEDVVRVRELIKRQFHSSGGKQ